MSDQVVTNTLEQMRSRNKLGILCKPEDVANIVLFLASPISRVITGETINANAGQFISF